MANISFDDSDFQRRITDFAKRVANQQMSALRVIADELLRLSQLEVPFKTGHLMGTGVSHPNVDEYIVGYNTPYAARLHEHPEFRFNNNRKGKYLEDPLKMNLRIFKNYFDDKMGEVYGGA